MLRQRPVQVSGEQRFLWRVRIFGSGLSGIYGKSFLRAETVPTRSNAYLWCKCDSCLLPMNTDVGTQDPCRNSRIQPEALGCAISEAVEAATTQEGYRYVLGSVLAQVMIHQSVIGLESKIALDKYGDKAGYHHWLRRRRFKLRRSDCSIYR